MGFIYCGFKTNNSKNGYMKIGESNQKYLSQRIGQIRKTQKNFVVYDYIEIENSTPALTRAIEGHIRFRLEQFGLNQVQNDHFTYTVGQYSENKEAEYNFLSNTAILYGIEYCNLLGIEYTVKSDKRNLRKTIKHKTGTA